jgi:hypothetical protein
VNRDGDIARESISRALPTAAIALPPQIDVPAETSNEVPPSMRKSLPSNQPVIIVADIVMTVKSSPIFPAATSDVRFIPKPRPTTDACNKKRDFSVRRWHGFPGPRPKNRPSANAIGGET